MPLLHQKADCLSTRVSKGRSPGPDSAMENHHDPLADGLDVDDPASWTEIRHRLSRDFILRHEEARMRAAEAKAALNGDHWEWDDDGAYVVIDPASLKAMLAMETPKVGETREQGCAVCLEGFVAGGKKLRMMPCSHSFHQRCIFDLLRRSRFCPVCRFEMPPRSADEPEPEPEPLLHLNKLAATELKNVHRLRMQHDRGKDNLLVGAVSLQQITARAHEALQAASVHGHLCIDEAEDEVRGSGQRRDAGVTALLVVTLLTCCCTNGN